MNANSDKFSGAVEVVVKSRDKLNDEQEQKLIAALKKCYGPNTLITITSETAGEFRNLPV